MLEKKIARSIFFSGTFHFFSAEYSADFSRIFRGFSRMCRRISKSNLPVVYIADSPEKICFVPRHLIFLIFIHKVSLR